VPWQRVINARGRISLPRRTGGYRRQKKLLEKEGVEFEKEIIDLDRFGLIQSFDRE
jgi:methylated-DNA-protein-cysteine methyltransferase-like protein